MSHKRYKYDSMHRMEMTLSAAGFKPSSSNPTTPLGSAIPALPFDGIKPHKEPSPKHKTVRPSPSP